jgi:hypothetical protein
MIRHHLAPLGVRILAALKVGEMDATALRHRLGAREIRYTLQRLERAGKVVCVERARSNQPSVWALAPEPPS